MTRQNQGRAALALTAVWFAATLGGCSRDKVFDAPVISADSVAALESDEADDDGSASAIRVLDLDTPDGTAQTVHPDYAALPEGSSRRFLVATPYTFSSSAAENPMFYAQQPDFSWAPRGLTNPIARPQSGYLSDPDIVALPDRKELWVYFREVNTQNSILLVKSTDGGMSWGERTQVVATPNHMVVSPSVVRRGASAWMMWSVNAGKQGCNGPSSTIELRRSRDGMAWSKPVKVALSQPAFKIWHIEVQWIESLREYWAVYNAKRGGICRTDRLFLATSPDGLHWTTYPSPLLAAGAVPEFADIVYRSTFAYNPRTDAVRFWYSGASYLEGHYVWRTAVQRRDRSEVFASIAKPASESIRLRRKREAPPLIDPP